MGADHFVSKPLLQSTVFNVLMTLSGGWLHTDTAKTEDFDFSRHRVLPAEDNELNSEIAIDLMGMARGKREVTYLSHRERTHGGEER